jgi:hypothetical protein
MAAEGDVVAPMLRRRARAEIQIRRNDCQGRRDENQAQRNESKIQRNEIQIQYPYFSAC